MKVSILDQAPIASGQTAREALLDSLKLAKAGETLGYIRYWIAEHHDLSGLACSAPEVMLSYLGANTTQIRLGAGAVLLPHYKPYKVAEVYNLLATLFPGRIDIGIGRAPGGSAEATNALSDNYLQQVWKMPELVTDLLHFLDDDYVTDNEYANLSASPIPEIAPEAWLLGTGKKSAELAAKKGLPYAFGQFMSERDGEVLVNQYRKEFVPRQAGDRSQVILTVSVICAESSDKAEEIALSSLVWGLQKEKGLGQQGVPSIKEAKEYPLTEKELDAIEKQKQKMIIGNPQEVASKLRTLQSLYQADELMLVTITNSLKDRIQSYKLVMEEIKKSSR
ncbi:LLM class flavin-dependent oxidoreductase [Mesobacillus maritimus]|uniref:LLM class flavin-dependent oxidoreductase n=1 Tax=Mesobacillus maritimus TaxID=1643336 RepID=A0ABS7K204_9BACI|nr:LLM class flavin-dependent oxidoreductase [Mesobacillus maritimus]MBY0096185.1 LLM class flavin-dependent oxidoreductase [Mesobacillus maritimus]